MSSSKSIRTVNATDDGYRLAVDRASMEAWRREEAAEEAEAGGLARELAGALTPLFLFIAKGRLGGTMDIRAWIVLYETRLDLINAESIEDFAKRRGVSPARVHTLIKEFRALVPGYRSAQRKSAAHVAAMRRAARGGGVSPTPGGKESFFAAGDSGGSALR